MPATQRRFEPGVIQRLLDAPYRFQFQQAVRLLELWLRQHGVEHELPLLDYVRFQNSLAVCFPASQIEALTASGPTPITTEADLLAALLNKSLENITITPAFMGLLGGSGALPIHYSERVSANLALNKDEGPRAFFDLLSNRPVALFYQAWNKHRIESLQKPDGSDGFLPLLLMLSGSTPAEPERRDADGITNEVRAHYAAIFRHRPVSAAIIAGVLSEYFEVPIAVEQCTGCWDVLHPDEYPRLGSANMILGQGAMIGTRSWRRDLRARLRIGPLCKADFDDFLPGASGARALKKMMAMFAVPIVKFEVQLVLRAQDVPRLRLGGGMRLGWDTFLLTKPEAADRDDVKYEL